MILLQSAVLIIVLFIVPFILGYPWSFSVSNKDFLAKTGYSVAMGYFVMLAIFELFILTAALFGVSVSLTFVLFSFSILMLCLAALLKMNRDTGFSLPDKFNCSRSEMVYGCVFFALFLMQLYYAVFYSRTYMADDGYVSFSVQALADNSFYQTDVSTGVYKIRDGEWLKRIIQAENFFPAYLSYITKINPTVIAHTVIYGYVLFIAYGVYTAVSAALFENREDRYIFLIFICLLYIYGYHSHYSLTFRLLGPSSEGKAILAVVLTPLMLLMICHLINADYHIVYGFQIMVLSLSACSLTLGGVYTVFSLLVTLVLLGLLKKKEKKYLLYLLWGGIMPGILACAYLVFKYA